jgi:hypothetical protein
MLDALILSFNFLLLFSLNLSEPINLFGKSVEFEYGANMTKVLIGDDAEYS